MKRIGRYEVRGLLGRGGMGAVYKVRPLGLNRILALKRLAPSEAMVALIGREEARRRFLAEARVMGALRHKNVAAVFDLSDGPDEPFFVMDYYARNLGDVIGESYELTAPSRPLGLGQAVRYAAQTLEGLSRLHHAGIVHRDVKPFNLLLTDEDTVRITDFGLSLIRGEKPGDLGRMRVGSPYYAAPEQEEDPASAGPAADLYSVGVTLYRFLTGRLPVGPERFPQGLDDRLRAVGEDFFARCLDPDPSRRFPDAWSMRRALTRAGEEWARAESEFCLFDPPDEAEREHGGIPRYRPEKVTPAAAPGFFGLDRLGRPQKYARPVFEPREDDTVLDRGAGLVWEAGGSEFPLTWPEAHEYAALLNRKRLAGYEDWRLPTVHELVRLIEPPIGPGLPCGAGPFPQRTKWLWSADRRSALAAWYVHVEMGFVSRIDHTCPLYVRAVRTL